MNQSLFVLFDVKCPILTCMPHLPRRMQGLTNGNCLDTNAIVITRTEIERPCQRYKY